MPSKIKTSKMREYDANDCTIMINDKLMYGFSENSMFTVTDKTDANTYKIDPQGSATKSHNNKTMAGFTLPLDETSPCNAYLLDLFNKDEFFTVDIIDSTSHISCHYASIDKIPDKQGGAQAGDRNWPITMLNKEETSNMIYSD